MTDTKTCKMMNKVYETLKTMTIPQLHETKALASAKLLNQSEWVLFTYQINETIRRKNRGIWQ